MNGIGVGNLGGTDNPRDIQVARREIRRSNADCLVCELDMEGIRIGSRINGYRLYL
jgi:hypothetical protein